MTPTPVREPFPCIAPLGPFLGSEILCPFCGSSSFVPWIAFPSPGCVDVRLDRPFVQLGLDPLEPIPGLELGLEVFVNDPGPWVPAAETGPWLTPGTGLRYAKLEEGSQLTRLLIESGGRFVDVKGGGCAPGQCDPLLAATATVEGAVAPPPREGHATVLSARRGTLWVLGGRSLADGSELHDVWAHDVARAEWRRLGLPPELALGRVLAATYSPADDRLWVLDEVGERGRERRARMLAIHPDGNAGEVLGSWRRRGHNERFALSAEPSGALWVAGWPTSGSVHAVLRLTRAGAALVEDGWALSVGRLVPDGARANDEGLTVIVDGRGRAGPEVRFHDVRSLRRGHGGPHACF
jgi:hypothetical protein